MDLERLLKELIELRNAGVLGPLTDIVEYKGVTYKVIIYEDTEVDTEVDEEDG